MIWQRHNHRWSPPGLLVALLLLLLASATTVRASDTVPTAPVLVEDCVPATALATVGEKVSFSAIFSNAPPPMFQWQKLAGGVALDIPGATNTTLTIGNVGLADAMSYRLKAISATNPSAVTFSAARPLSVMPLPPPVDNVITLVAAQTGLGGGTSFTPTWDVATNNNLLFGCRPRRFRGNFSMELAGRSVSSLTDGGRGTLQVVAGKPAITTSKNYVTCGTWGDAGASLTYRLTGSPNGYDLTNIVVYGGWGDGNRDQQAYIVYYATVAAPAHFIRLATVNYNPADPANGQSATRITLQPAGGALARNVVAVAFDFTALPSKNGFCGYSQIAMSGPPSASPPPPGSLASPGAGGNDNRYAFSELDSLGSWIWDRHTFDKQTCLFWKTVDIPPGQRINDATLIMTADNEYLLYLDGRLIGRADDWREYWVYDVTLLMTPGRHVLAVKAYNSSAQAGVIFGLHIDFENGDEAEVKSDASWNVVPSGTRHWETKSIASADWQPATVVSEFGQSPWDTIPVILKAGPPLEPVKILFWQTPWFQVPFAIVCGLAVLTIFLLAAQLALHEKERRLLQRERARIAMDIHDDIGSRITQLVLNGEDAEAALPEGSALRMRLGEVWDDARRVLSSIDEVLWALNPRLDTLRDFADYVCDYAHKFLEPSGIACVFEVDPQMQLTAADLPLRRSLLMAIKETLNNTVKHAGATELRLKIERRRQHLVIVVQDNGRGFDPAATTPGRNGLANISRRLCELGGTCHITSQPGQGCRIEFNIPLRRPGKFFRL